MVALVWPNSTSPGLKPSEGAGRLINCYAEPMGKGGRAEYTIHRIPGMTEFGTSSRTGFRGGIVVAGVLYAAFNGKLEKWTSSGGASTNVGNLTGTKARLLLMACLLKFGSLPAAKDPNKPTSEEIERIRKAIAAYQAVFDMH